MTTLEFVNLLLSVLTIVAQVFLVLGIIYFLFFGRKGNSRPVNFLARRGIIFAFFVSLVATASSLFYSNIAGFPACELCWFQRIAMYPQVVLLGLAILKKEKVVIDYCLLLAGFGVLVSAYHNYIYYGGTSLSSCSAFGLGTSCLVRYVWEFNYVTIPLMALTSLLLVIFLLAVKRLKGQEI